jgi:hypothetical protein
MLSQLVHFAYCEVVDGPYHHVTQEGTEKFPLFLLNLHITDEMLLILEISGLHFCVTDPEMETSNVTFPPLHAHGQKLPKCFKE